MQTCYLEIYNHAGKFSCRFSELEAKGLALTGQQLSDNLEPLKSLHLDEHHLRYFILN